MTRGFSIFVTRLFSIGEATVAGGEIASMIMNGNGAG